MVMVIQICIWIIQGFVLGIYSFFVFKEKDFASDAPEKREKILHTIQVICLILIITFFGDIKSADFIEEQ